MMLTMKETVAVYRAELIALGCDERMVERLVIEDVFTGPMTREAIRKEVRDQASWFRSLFAPSPLERAVERLRREIGHTHDPNHP